MRRAGDEAKDMIGESPQYSREVMQELGRSSGGGAIGGSMDQRQYKQAV